MSLAHLHAAHDFIVQPHCAAQGGALSLFRRAWAPPPAVSQAQACSAAAGGKARAAWRVAVRLLQLSNTNWQPTNTYSEAGDALDLEYGDLAS
jgi:hypothetical protein